MEGLRGRGARQRRVGCWLRELCARRGPLLGRSRRSVGLIWALWLAVLPQLSSSEQFAAPSLSTSLAPSSSALSYAALAPKGGDAVKAHVKRATSAVRRADSEGWERAGAGELLC